MKKKLFILSQYLLPQHALSRLAGRSMTSTCTWWKNALIRQFLKTYPVNMAEALNSDPFAYPNFNEFFTRKLKPGIRPIAMGKNEIISPVDGTISQIGAIEEKRMIQAKGSNFTIEELLAGDKTLAAQFKKGLFSTIYLAPHDYHHVHMPLSGTLKQMTIVPGQLFSVNQMAAEAIPRLFARNERVIFSFETDRGPMVVVMVGAFLVASIATSWAGILTPQSSKTIETHYYKENEIVLSKGAELGYFRFGSTAIVLFPDQQAHWLPNLQTGVVVKMGQQIGTLNE